MTSSPLPDDNQRHNLAVTYRLMARFPLTESNITHISALGGSKGHLVFPINRMVCAFTR